MTGVLAREPSWFSANACMFSAADGAGCRLLCALGALAHTLPFCGPFVNSLVLHSITPNQPHTLKLSLDMSSL
jgi:hypothetical protein